MPVAVGRSLGAAEVVEHAGQGRGLRAVRALASGEARGLGFRV